MPTTSGFQVESAFLELIGRDIEEHPDRVADFPEELAAIMREIIKGIEVGLEEEIVGPVDLDERWDPDAAQRLAEWAANPREGLAGVYDEEFPGDAD